MRWGLNLWPPFLFNAIRVQHIAEDWHSARVVLRKHWYNRNYVNTQFGGNLFAMNDPFWMLLTMQLLGPDYIIWDKAGAIEFVAPGRGDVSADFRVSHEVIDTIRAATAAGGKYLHWFENEVRDDAGVVIAKVRKQVYFRRKRPKSGADTAPE
ncbi:MAG: DUF4442 domain-containing protein [Dokdonella sp.]